MNRRLTLWMAALVAISIAPAVLAQCSMCRGALESPEGSSLAWAFRHAILFLLAAPFVAVVVIAVLAARAVELGQRASDGSTRTGSR